MANDVLSEKCPKCENRWFCRRDSAPMKIDCYCGHSFTIEASEPGPAPRSAGTSYVPPPPSAGKIVSMIVFRDGLYVAFEHGLYRHTDNPIPSREWQQVLPVPL